MLMPDSPDDAAFRREVRSVIAATLPAGLREQTLRPPPAEILPWMKALAARNWLAPHWPARFGGPELSPARQMILIEEQVAAGCPEVSLQGVNHVAPILMKLGTPEQQARHLPPILAADTIWCQGYSEPESGSDLASLRCRAARDGDDLVIEGQKIWTTWAHYADWMYALVRTGASEPKQGGITFVLIDMRSPGIAIRPIRTIAGEDEFAQVTFSAVRVPVTNVVGAVDQGWKVATAVLDEERLRIGSPMQPMRALRRARAVAEATGALADAAYRDRLAAVSIDVEALKAAYRHGLELAAAGRMPGAESSFLKLFTTETLQRACDLLFEAAGAAAPGLRGIDTALGRLDVTELMMQARRATIYGGSSEVQRGILARRALNLPG